MATALGLTCVAQCHAGEGSYAVAASNTIAKVWIETAPDERDQR
jgi:hypothetical protein